MEWLKIDFEQSIETERGAIWSFELYWALEAGNQPPPSREDNASYGPSIPDSVLKQSAGVTRHRSWEISFNPQDKSMQPKMC